MLRFKRICIVILNITVMSIGTMGLVVQFVLREVAEKPGISPIYEWIDPAITCFVLVCIAILLKSTGIIKHERLKITAALLLTGFFIIKALTIPFKTSNYIQLESPNQKYKVLIENSHRGFDVGVSCIYTKENTLFKKAIGDIERDKRGAAIGADLEELSWVNDSIAIVEFYDYKNVHKIFKVDFQKGSINECK